MVQEKDFIIDMRDSTQLRLTGLNWAMRRDRGRKGEREKQRERGGGPRQPTENL